MICFVCAAPAVVALVNYVPSDPWRRLVPPTVFAHAIYGVCAQHAEDDVREVMETRLLELIDTPSQVC